MKFVAEARNSHGSSSKGLIKQALDAISAASKEARKMIEKIPDVTQSEPRFLAYMSRNGNKLADHKATLEQHGAAFDGLVRKLHVDGEDADPEQNRAECSNDAKDIMSAITIFTMVTLLRNPAVRNPQEATLRKSLKSVRDQLDLSVCMDLIPDLLKEVADIIGEAAGGGGMADGAQPSAASPSAPQEGTARRARGRGRALPEAPPAASAKRARAK